MKCSDADLLIDACAEDALDAAARASLDPHLAACARCRAALAASRRLSASLAALPFASPSAAADLRVLAAAEEERAWARRRTRLYRTILGAAAAAAVVGVVAVGPVATWISTAAPPLARAGEAWMRAHSTSLADARGPLVGAVVLLLGISLMDRAFSRRPSPRAAR
jgi:anti-sigma factor RsiW